MPLPAFSLCHGPSLCHRTVLEHTGEVFLGDEGYIGFVLRADGSKGDCGLPHCVTGTQDTAPLCLRVHLSEGAAAPCPATLMPGAG